MNRNGKLALGICGTVFVATMFSFAVFHYVPKTDMSMIYVGNVFVSLPGILLSLRIYDKGRLTELKEPEAPLMDEEKIHEQLNRDSDSPGTELATPSEIIEQGRSGPAIPIPPNPSEAIKVVMQNKVIEALQKCECSVSIDTGMSLEGDFQEPKIVVAFHPKTPVTPGTSKKEEKKKTPDDEKLTPPRI